MQSNRITDMAELILDKVSGVSAKEFDDIVKAKGRQLFGEFFFYASDYDKKVGSGRYVIARRPIKNLAHVLKDDRNFYYKNGKTFYLIEAGQKLTISQELPGGYVDIVSADFSSDPKDKKKKLQQLQFSISSKSILPYVLAFGVVFTAVVVYLLVMRSELTEIDRQVEIKRTMAPKVEKSDPRLPDFSTTIESVASEVLDYGYITQVELSGNDKLRFFVECFEEEAAYKLAERMKGELKDGKVQFVR